MKERICFRSPIISKDGIEVDKSHIQRFKFKRSSNKKGVQKILGFFNYFKSFIHNFSEKPYS